MANAYPLVLAGGIGLGLLWLGYAQRESNPAASIDLGLVATFAGLIGARLGHVAAYWDYYSSRLTEAAQFWQGGLSWAGAALGSLLGVALYDAIVKRSFWADADRLAPPALVVGSAAWLGCLLDACAYGLPTPYGTPLPDLLGVVAPRWPTQAIGGVLTLLALAVSYRLSVSEVPEGLGAGGISKTPDNSQVRGASAEAKLAPGVLAASTLTALGTINFGLSFLRGDPTPVVGGLRLDGIAAALLMTLGAVGLVMRR